MANTLGAASIPFLACASLLFVLVLQITAFASPYWASMESYDFGLWRYAQCIPTKLNSANDQGCRNVEKAHDVGDWLWAVRILECLAIIFWSFPIVIVPVYLYVALGLYYKCVMGLMTLFTLVGSICNIIGIVIFGIKINDNPWDLEWCLVVAAVAGILGIFTFIIFAVSCLNRPVFSSHTHFTSGFYVDPDRNRMYVIENLDDKPGPMEGGHVNPAMAN